MQHKIGEGMYGVVYKAVDRCTNEVRVMRALTARARACLALSRRATRVRGAHSGRAAERLAARVHCRHQPHRPVPRPRCPQSVAIKRVLLDHDEGVPCTAMREISLLKDSRCEFIVR